MIPRAAIVAWRKARAPWKDDASVEQDLVISRALVSLFSDPVLKEKLRFRGGTCLQKLYLDPPTRYSEDIDLVQVPAEPIKKTTQHVRSALEWLGKPSYERSHHSVRFVFRFETEIEPVERRKLKVEINTREHFSVFDPAECPFQIENDWFGGEASIPTYHPDELLGTKLRALYQRPKGRDLFDLWVTGDRLELDPPRVVEAFREYLARQDLVVTRGDFLKNLEAKMADAHFRDDVLPLLPPDIDYDPDAARAFAEETYIALL